MFGWCISLFFFESTLFPNVWNSLENALNFCWFEREEFLYDFKC